MDREKVVAWLTEISLRPCDFATDDFDAYETEHLANEALEICEAAKVFNKQRNDALAMLKEQEAVVHCGDCENFCFDNISPNAGRCMLTNMSHSKTWFCAHGKREEGR